MRQSTALTVIRRELMNRHGTVDPDRLCELGATSMELGAAWQLRVYENAIARARWCRVWVTTGSVGMIVCSFLAALASQATVIGGLVMVAGTMAFLALTLWYGVGEIE
jgi:hypothetical protein